MLLGLCKNTHLFNWLQKRSFSWKNSFSLSKKNAICIFFELETGKIIIPEDSQIQWVYNWLNSQLKKNMAAVFEESTSSKFKASRLKKANSFPKKKSFEKFNIIFSQKTRNEHFSKPPLSLGMEKLTLQLPS